MLVITNYCLKYSYFQLLGHVWIKKYQYKLITKYIKNPKKNKNIKPKKSYNIVAFILISWRKIRSCHHCTVVKSPRFFDAFQMLLIQVNKRKYKKQKKIKTKNPKKITILLCSF